MKTVKFLSLALASSFVLFSCKNSEKSIPDTDLTNDLALVETDVIEENSSETFLYVTASTGLSLREYANLKSEKLAVMPYGTKIKVIAAEENPTMTIAGIKGGMDQIEYNHKKGFAFNGYLSRFFPPEVDISAKGYAKDLKEVFPKVSFTETTGGTASEPTNTETLSLPTSQWHEAFYIAQRLFEFPSEFVFPNPKGKNSQIIKDSKPKKNVWVSELHISRKDDVLTKIEYLYKSKGFESKVTISQEDEMMKIKKVELVK